MSNKSTPIIHKCAHKDCLLAFNGRSKFILCCKSVVVGIILEMLVPLTIGRAKELAHAQMLLSKKQPNPDKAIKLLRRI